MLIRMPSPLGLLLLTATDVGLLGLRFEATGHGPSDGAIAPDGGDRAAATLTLARSQLEEYFTHQRTTFDVPLDLRGTAFQRRVWDELRRIAYGTTLSYGELARRIGAPGAIRAVGAANGRNPVAIIVPCHRVIGAHGELTGFGGGIERKRWLLRHEDASQELAFG